MDPRDLEILHILQEDREWIWIAGNHDPEIDGRLAGYVVAELDVAGITLRHEPAAGAADARDRRPLASRRRLVAERHILRRPCFVGNGLRLVVPAFGAYTGGLNILDDAFEPLFGDDGMRCGCSARRGFTPWRRGC